MSGAGRLLVDTVFVFSVIFIWAMILYQFVLTVGGFLWRRKVRREDAEADRADAAAKAAGDDSPDGRLPRVSVLVPARNEEKVVGDLVARIRAFDYPADRIEVIVVDDGSADRTAEIVRAIGAKDRRIRLMTIPPGESGRGKAAALNRALLIASHPLIAVYDADNRPEPDSLRRLARALAADPKLAAVTGKFRAYNRRRNLLTRLVNLESIAFQWLIQAGRWHFLRVAFIPGTNFLIRRDALERAGGWDPEALTEDTELTFRLYRLGYRVKFLPTAVTWEQEPERLRTWVRQRTRWARGNSYVIATHGRRLLRGRPNLASLEVLNLVFLYYVFIFAVLFSDLLFALSVAGVVKLRIPGPYAELWGLAFCLFLLEIAIALAFEKEDTAAAVPLALVAYVAYTKLWAFVVLRALYEDLVLRRARVWAKTERFEPGPLPGETPGEGGTRPSIETEN